VDELNTQVRNLKTRSKELEKCVGNLRGMDEERGGFHEKMKSERRTERRMVERMADKQQATEAMLKEASETHTKEVGDLEGALVSVRETMQREIDALRENASEAGRREAALKARCDDVKSELMREQARHQDTMARLAVAKEKEQAAIRQAHAVGREAEEEVERCAELKRAASERVRGVEDTESRLSEAMALLRSLEAENADLRRQVREHQQREVRLGDLLRDRSGQVVQEQQRKREAERQARLEHIAGLDRRREAEVRAREDEHAQRQAAFESEARAREQGEAKREAQLRRIMGGRVSAGKGGGKAATARLLRALENSKSKTNARSPSTGTKK